ncbi:MAG: quinolinate synthase NadA [Candidatus Omnitrophota bacterium]
MDIIKRINALKKEKNAVILAHNYQLPEVQDIADYIGDSLGLSRQAADTDADVIVFCGVRFMAETAKILSPEKTVLIPDIKAGCPMADMITAEQLREAKARNPQAKVLCYVNTSAEVKAESDLCCTSANAINMVQDVLVNNEEILFVPDKYLARYTAQCTGREFIFWHGYCPTHVKILAEDILRQKQLHPEAEVMVHPECNAEVCGLADAVLSTGGMSKYARESAAREFIVGTENGMIYPLRKDNPGKKFYPASLRAICPNMKLTTLEKVLHALEYNEHEITVPEHIRVPAKEAIEAMLNGGELVLSK